MSLGISGKSLLMLSQEDLVRHGIATPIVQRRLLDEIFGLKLQVARGKYQRKMITKIEVLVLTLI